MNKLIELKNAIKSKILFQSEDGVDIFEGDEYWFIVFNKENYSALRDMEWKPIKEIAKDSNPQFKHEKIQKHLGNKTFSTREKADEYILLNKPCLSLKEVLDNNRPIDVQTIRDNFIKLVKEKIK